MDLVRDKYDFTIRWRPFLLDATLPGGAGTNKREFYARKFGPQASAVIQGMTQTMAEHDIAYSVGGNLGNTLDSHRLLAAAEAQDGTYGVQNKLVEALFMAYFTQEKCISDRSVLLEAARASGVADADAILDDPAAYADDVARQMRSFAGRFGVRGVPHFVFNEKLHVSGAQDADLLLEAIEESCG